MVSYINMFRKFWEFSIKDRSKIMIYFLFHIVSLLAVLMQPYIFGKIFNTLQQNTTNALEEIIELISLYIILFFIFNIFHRLGRFIEQRVSFRSRQKFINDIYEKILKLPMSWHQDNHSGDVINRINTASNALYTFGEKQFLYIEYFMMFWGPLIALTILSYKIALIAFLISLIIIYFISVFDKIIVPLFVKENETQHRFLAILFDQISNIKTIINLNIGNKTKNELNKKIEEAYIILVESVKKNQYKWATVSFFILTLEISIILYYIFIQIEQNNLIMIGYVVAVFQYLQQLSKMFFNIAASLQEIVQLKTDFQSIETINYAYNNFGKSNLERCRKSNLKQWDLIELEGINFRYHNKENFVLKNIQFSFRKNSKIALIGESGSGKSTLLNILKGLYPLHAEKILIDKENIKDPIDIFNMTSLILQEPEIFENTLKYNICFDNTSNSNELLEIIKICCLEDFIKKLPKGLDTDIREKGINLSGGEKQRLALARGLLMAKNSSILLLDEPTSSVDISNEIKIYTNILKCFENKCIISSVHRLHFLNKFHTIFVMDEGKIVQNGSFESLKNKKGLFLELWEKYLKEHNKI